MRPRRAIVPPTKKQRIMEHFEESFYANLVYAWRDVLSGKTLYDQLCGASILAGVEWTLNGIEGLVQDRRHLQRIWEMQDEVRFLRTLAWGQFVYKTTRKSDAEEEHL